MIRSEKLYLVSQIIAFSFAYGLNITILHTNDIHCRYSEINISGQKCKTGESCFGGVARLKSAIDVKRATQRNIILLDAGDVQTGSLWYLYYRGNASSRFLRQLQYDVVVPGNHDFDGGSSQLFHYLKQLSTAWSPFNHTIDIIFSNVNITKSNSPSNRWSMIKDHVIKILPDGTKVGICGYIIPETKQFSHPPEEFEFLDEISSVRRCAHYLTNNGIKIIIALGHSGVEMDLKIAKEVDEVDIVVGGHSHTFLYSGDAPSTNTPYGEYPLVVRSKGKNKLVVQAYSFSKYLGNLNVEVDDVSGDVIGWSGNPILLYHSIAPNVEMSQEVAKLYKNVEQMENEVIGSTNISLDNDGCREIECTFGNLVADAMACAFNCTSSANVLAFITGNTISSSIKQGSTINFGLLYDSLPYQNDLVIVEIKGKFIRQALQISASNWKKGQFLQTSGLVITYGIDNNDNSIKLNQILISNQQSITGDKLQELQNDVNYKVVVTSYIFLYETYSVIRNNAITWKNLGLKEIDAVRTYIKQQKHATVNKIKQGRIRFSKIAQNASGIITINNIVIFLPLLLYIMI